MKEILYSTTNYIILNPYYYNNELILSNEIFNLSIKPYFKLSKETRQLIQYSPKTKLESIFNDIEIELLPNSIAKIISSIRYYNSLVLVKNKDEIIYDTSNNCTMLKSAIKFNKDIPILHINEYNELNLYHCLYYNDINNIIIELNSDKYIIPSDSSFILCDIALLKYIKYPSKYDILLLDPPWQSMSVKRSEVYNYMSLPVLYKYLSEIKPYELLNNDGIVAIWITNDPRIKNWVINELFPKWNIIYYTTWFWIKITSYGLPVLPFSYSSRLPYECVLIGYLKEKELPNNIKENFMIISPPIGHSIKPNLSSVFEKLYNHDIKGVEYFSRQLRSNWLSIGNEVLKYQNTKCYKKVDDIDDIILKSMNY